MTVDAPGDQALTAELAVIDASLESDSAAALRAGLAGWPRSGGHVDRMAGVRARRAVVVDLLTTTALPRRLRRLDEWLVELRDDLAEARETFAGMAVASAAVPADLGGGAPSDRDDVRHWIDLVLMQISCVASYRADVIARLRALDSSDHPKKEASEKRFSGPWRGFGPAPLGS